MCAAAVGATAGFTALGAVFDYPAILDEPTSELLRTYRAHQAGVTVGFLALIAAAALLAPIAVLLSRLAVRRRRWIVGLGTAAAAVQVIGLSRWILFVPGISDDVLRPDHAAAAHDRFELLHTWLGQALGETVGDALTAASTIVAVGSLPGVPRWIRTLGITAAVLVASGVLIPLDVPAADLTNFAGYILWTVWLVVLAVSLVRHNHRVDRSSPVIDRRIVAGEPVATVGVRAGAGRGEG